MQVQVTVVNNPFNRHEKDIAILDQVGWELVASELEKRPEDTFFLYVNGKPCPINHKMQDNDQIVIIPRIAEGDDGKQILSIVAMVALMYFGGAFLGNQAWAVNAAGTGLNFAGTMAMAGIMVAGGLLMSTLMPAPKADNAGMADFQNSYGWNPQNTQQQGLTIPRWYGKNQIFGNVIAVHTETQAGDDTKEILKALVNLGMGPIKGIVDNKVLINGQAYTAYDNVTIEERRGLMNQEPISFFEETKPEYRIGILVENGSPQTYLAPDSDFDALEIIIAFDRGLYYANDQGGISSHSVGLKIEVREQGGTWSTLMESSVTSNSTAALYKTYRTDATYTGGSPVTITQGKKYEIQVTKTTTNQTSSRYGDRVKLSAIREVLKDEFTYPRKALIGIEALATDQLSGGFQLACIQEGLIINTYNGSAWTLQYSNNPAWVIFDILTQPVITGNGDDVPYSVVRYEGLHPDRLDLLKFYELAVFCDELVSDGKGGTEKRITFNGGFESGMTMWEAALKVCQIARCILVWNGMNLTLAINKPGTAVMTFSDGNIVAGTFKETFLPAEDRISELEVSYVDSDKDFEKTVFSIYDPESDLFYNKSTLDLYGITKESEAWRAGMFRLLQNRYLYSTVEFEADIDAIACTLGDIIFIQSSIPKWGEGGRVVSATEDTVTLDRYPDLGEGAKKILVTQFDETTQAELFEEKDVLDITDDVVTIDGTWTNIPAAYAVYSIGLTQDVSKKYTVINMRKSADQRVTITAIEYNPAVYGGDDSDPVIPSIDYTSPGSNGTSIIKPPSVEGIKNIYPIESIFMESPGVTADIPLFNGFAWTDNAPSAGAVTTAEFTIYYKGVSYTVASFTSSDQFFYWNPAYNPGTGAGTALQSTNSLASVLGYWVVGLNLNGTLIPRYGSQLIHGGLIQASTVSADAIAADAITADKINVTDLSAISANLGTIEVDTANIADLSVETLKIANNAVTRGSTGSTDAFIGLNNTWQTLASTSITSIGGRINVRCSARIIFPSTSNDPQEYGPMSVRVNRTIGGTTTTISSKTFYPKTTLAFWDFIYLDFDDIDVTAGTVTYEFQAYHAYTSYGSGSATNRTIAVLNLAK